MGQEDQGAPKEHLSGSALLIIASCVSLLSLFVSLMGAMRIGATLIGLIGFFQVVGEARKKQPEKNWVLVLIIFIIIFLATGASTTTY